MVTDKQSPVYSFIICPNSIDKNEIKSTVPQASYLKLEIRSATVNRL